jgi:hypothetical protein
MKKAGLTPKIRNGKVVLGDKEVKGFKYNPGGVGGYEVNYGQRLETVLGESDEYTNPSQIYGQMKREGLSPQFTGGRVMFGGQEVTLFDPSEGDAGYEIAYKKKEKRPQTLLSSEDEL